MKLVIKETCVVDGGKVAVRGDIFDTKIEDKRDDRTAFELVLAGRAVKAGTAEADEVLAEVKKEKEAAEQAARTSKK